MYKKNTFCFISSCSKQNQKESVTVFCCWCSVFILLISIHIYPFKDIHKILILLIYSFALCIPFIVFYLMDILVVAAVDILYLAHSLILSIRISYFTLKRSTRIYTFHKWSSFGCYVCLYRRL